MELISVLEQIEVWNEASIALQQKNGYDCFQKKVFFWLF